MDAVTKEQWAEASVESITPLGKVEPRKLTSRQ